MFIREQTLGNNVNEYIISELAQNKFELMVQNTGGIVIYI